MLKNLVERRAVELVEKRIEFTDNDGAGFSFDCDEKGNPIFMIEEARKNYEYAMQHPELFPVQFNELVTHRRRYIEPASGTCKCGEKVELYNEYMGACECPKCGQWYNLYGQELIDPEYWED